MCVICCLLRFGVPRSPGSDLSAVTSLLAKKRESEICPDRDYQKYDAAGIMVNVNKEGNVRVAKAEGKIQNLEEKMEKEISAAISDDEASPPKTNGNAFAPQTKRPEEKPRSRSELDLSLPTDGCLCVGHTRWATHGTSRHEANIHPQRSDGEEFYVVHNGIVENVEDLKNFLWSEGYHFRSQTDTEVITQLAHYFYHNEKGTDDGKMTFREVVERVTIHLAGAYSLVFLSSLFPGECVATCRGSALYLDLAGERFRTDVGVEYSVFNENVPGKGIVVPLDEFVEEGKKQEAKYSNRVHALLKKASVGLTPGNKGDDDGFEIFISTTPHSVDVNKQFQRIKMKHHAVAHISSLGALTISEAKFEDMTKGDSPRARSILSFHSLLRSFMLNHAPNFMIKEIREQAETIEMCLKGRLLRGEPSETCKEGEGYVYLPSMRRAVETNIHETMRSLVVVGEGTSINAAYATRVVLEELTDAAVFIEESCNFLDKEDLSAYTNSSVMLFLSQSGECSETVAALNRAKKGNCTRMGITNVSGSQVCQGTEAGIHVRSGPQVARASTKVFTAQILSLNLLACFIGQEFISKADAVKRVIDGMFRLPGQVLSALGHDGTMAKVASRLLTRLPNGPFLIIGRGSSRGTIREAALKLKEVTYMPCQGILAGELKHGPLAQIDPGMPVIVVIPKDGVYTKTLAAVSQLIARQASVIAITTDDNSELDDMWGVEQVIKVPSTEDSLQPILTAVPLQLLAYHLALIKGRDVDNPRHLKPQN